MSSGGESKGFKRPGNERLTRAMLPNSRLGQAAQARDRRTTAGNEKGRALEPSLDRCRSCRAKETGYIPTPPRTMTKLFDATCHASVAGHLEKTGEVARRPYPFRRQSQPHS